MPSTPFVSPFGNGVSGLLSPNGDESALLHHWRTVASGTIFARHILPVKVAREAALKFSLQRHIERMRGIFAAVVQSRDSEARGSP